MEDSIVHRALCPRIAVLTSPDVDSSVHANGATHLVDLLRPFEHATENVTLRTSQLETRVAPVYPVRFDRLDAFKYQDGLDIWGEFLDMIQRSFHDNPVEDTVAVPLDPGDMDRATWQTQVQKAPNLFRHFMSHILHFRPLWPHDTMSHPCALVLAVTSHGPDPLNAFASLYETCQKSEIFAQQAYMESNLLRCYLVLHDCAQLGSDMTRSMAVLDEVRKTYGVHCALLPINSANGPDEDAAAFFAAAFDVTDPRNAPETPSIPRGAALSMDDIQRLRAYVREFIIKSLVPFLESTVHHLGEQVAAQRKGLTGRLLGAGRKFFAGRTGTSTQGIDATQGIYPANSTTAQTRRLADLAMHVRDYRLAVQMYEAARRDFQSDQAAWYSAFAAEMLCISRLLYSFTSKSSQGSLEPLLMAACDEFASSRAGAWFSLRAAVLYAHLQHVVGDHYSAAIAYLRVADSSDEVTRALLLEHASWAYLRMSRPHLRRSAAALLRAASQYNSCGQKTLALRAFSRLQDYYRTRHSSLHDYTLFQKSILYHTLGLMDEALQDLLPLLHGCMPDVDESRLRTLESLAAVANKTIVSLPTPLIRTEETRIVTMGQTEGVPVAAVQEPFQVHFTVANTFGVQLRMSDVQFHFVIDDTDAPVEADHTVDTLLWAPYECSPIQVPISLRTKGMVRLDRITYKLMDVLPVTQSLAKQGPRLNKTPEQRRSRMYGRDTSLLVQIRESIPRIQCTVNAPPRAAVGELVEVTLTLKNVSTSSARNISLVSSPCHLMPVPTASSKLKLPWRIPTPTPIPLDDLASHVSVPICFQFPVLSLGTEYLTWQIQYHSDQGEIFTTRLEHEIHTFPMLEAQVSYKLARSVQPQYHLRLTIKNISQDPIEITGIAFASLQWQLSLDFNQISLNSGHAAQWLVYGQRKQGLDTLRTTVELLRPFFQGREVPVHPPELPMQVFKYGEGPVQSLLHWPALYAAVRNVHRRYEVEKWYDCLPTQVQEEVLPLMDSNQVDIIVAWRAASGVVGEALVSGAYLGFRDDAVSSIQALDYLLHQVPSTRAMYTETDMEKQAAREQLAESPLMPTTCPLSVLTGTLKLTVPDHAHALQLPLYVRNESPWPLSCTLWLEPATDVQAVPHVSWLGKTTHHILVPGWCAEKVSVKVLVDGPGTYRLGNWRIEARMCDGETPVRSSSTAGSLTTPFIAYGQE